MRSPDRAHPLTPRYLSFPAPIGALGLTICLILVLGPVPERALASAPRDRSAPQARAGPMFEIVPRPTEPVPLFAGPATLELDGRDGAYAWDELRFGADQVILSLTASGGERPCGIFLALGDTATDEPPGAALADDPPADDDLLASTLVTTGPGEVASHETSMVVDYATASLRLIATCERWTLRLEPLADPNLTYEVEEQTYRVRGRTIHELAAQADQAQDGWAAFADWRTDWRFWWLDSGTSCDVTEGEVELQARITYPAWRPPAGVGPGVVAHWQRFMDDLTTHELGHITIALQGANAIDELFDAGVTAATCAEVERVADRAASHLHDRFERVNRRYDESTDHGVAQGTGLP
jgi:predicted secreted Zn-dependent protease